MLKFRITKQRQKSRRTKKFFVLPNPHCALWWNSVDCCVEFAWLKKNHHFPIVPFFSFLHDCKARNYRAFGALTRWDDTWRYSISPLRPREGTGRLARCRWRAHNNARRGRKAHEQMAEYRYKFFAAMKQRAVVGFRICFRRYSRIACAAVSLTLSGWTRFRRYSRAYPPTSWFIGTPETSWLVTLIATLNRDFPDKCLKLPQIPTFFHQHFALVAFFRIFASLYPNVRKSPKLLEIFTFIFL